MFLLFITFEGRRKKSQSAYSEEQQTMDLKGQKVKLNDGYFIPVLRFGTYAPSEVTVLVVGWDINSSGCDMSKRDLGCQALSSCVTLGGSRGSTNQARNMPCERGESIQSSLCIRAWGCAHLQITLGFPQFLFLSQLCRRGDSWLSRSLAVCFVLRAIATAGFLYVFH